MRRLLSGLVVLLCLVGAQLVQLKMYDDSMGATLVAAVVGFVAAMFGLWLLQHLLLAWFALWGAGSAVGGYVLGFGLISSLADGVAGLILGLMLLGVLSNLRSRLHARREEWDYNNDDLWGLVGVRTPVEASEAPQSGAALNL